MSTRRAAKAVENAVEAARRERRKPRVLFVCLGNICRSPAANGIAEAMARSRGADIDFDSAGFYGGHAGQLPDPRMRRAAMERGYDLRHRARKIQPWDLDDFDLVLGMDDNNMDDLHQLASTLERDNKVVRITDFADPGMDADAVPDPYYGGDAGFRHVLDLLENCCSNIVDSFARRPQPKPL